MSNYGAERLLHLQLTAPKAALTALAVEAAPGRKTTWYTASLDMPAPEVHRTLHLANRLGFIRFHRGRWYPITLRKQ